MMNWKTLQMVSVTAVTGLVVWLGVLHSKVESNAMKLNTLNEALVEILKDMSVVETKLISIEGKLDAMDNKLDRLANKTNLPCRQKNANVTDKRVIE
jgi:hypothetical protein